MNFVDNFLYDSNPWLLFIGGVMCFVGSLCLYQLRSRMQDQSNPKISGWIFLASSGFAVGLWAVQTILVGSFGAGLQIGCSPIVGLFNLLLIAVGTTLALTIAWEKDSYINPLAGSLVLAIISSAGQFLAFQIFHWSVNLQFDPLCGTAVTAVSFVFFYLSMLSIKHSSRFSRQCLAAGLMCFAVIAGYMIYHSGLSMGSRVILTENLDLIHPQIWLSIVGVLSTIALVGGFGIARIDYNRSVDSLLRFRRLANAAREGIVIIQDGVICDSNAFFNTLVQGSSQEPAEALIGKALFHEILKLDLQKLETSEYREGWLQPFDLEAPAIPVEVHLEDESLIRSDKDHVIVTIRDMRAQKAAEQHIHFLAEHDALTGLPNRAAMQARLSESIQNAHKSHATFALICVNLDGFKVINDLHGQTLGDTLLAGMAHRLSTAVTAPSFVARYGGDEFIILRFLEEQEKLQDLADWSQNLLKDIAEPMYLFGHKIVPSASMGISVFPNDGEDIDTLLVHTDTALQRAKHAAHQNFCFFECETDNRAQEQRNLARELHKAIENKELVVYYQPQGRTEDASLCGFEALLRWIHPERGMIAPDVFIPMAERHGLILEIGEWVLYQACEEAASWPEHISLAVNLSPLQLNQPDLAARIRQILFETGMSPSRLEFEITESALIHNHQGALDTLRQIKAMGIRVAMDDFGTGFSSLSTLQSFPFDKIKIDKSFVQGIGHLERSTVIVRAVLGIGRGLDIPVVAEGVETHQQLAFLKKENCAVIQGYLLDQPAPIEAHKRLFSHCSWKEEPEIVLAQQI